MFIHFAPAVRSVINLLTDYIHATETVYTLSSNRNINLIRRQVFDANFTNDDWSALIKRQSAINGALSGAGALIVAGA